MVSQKKRASNDRYNEKCVTIYLKPLKERGAAIRAAAAASGQSLQGYCLHAIEYYMEHIDNKTPENKTEEQNA